MDDPAHPVHVVQADEALPRESPHQRQWHSLVVVPLDDLEEVHSQDLEDHDEVLSIWAMVNEGVQQLSAMRALRYHTESFQAAHQVLVILVVLLDGVLPLFGFPVLGNLIQDVDLIVSCLNIVLGTLLNLQCDIAIESQILG